MAQKSTKWNPTCKRFVAFFDIMGFKDTMFRNTHKEVYEMLESFVSDINIIDELAKRYLAGTKSKSGRGKIASKSVIRSVLFSDSIIIVSNDDSDKTFIDFIATIEWMFERAMIEKIPIKGAIAYGEQTADFDKSLHFGRPLIDAFELQDELLLYGTVLHHTVEKYLIENEVIDTLVDKWIIKWSIPMKSATVSHYILDCVTSPTSDKKIKEAIPNLYRISSGEARRYIDNTVEFVQWLDTRKKELARKKKTSRRPSTKRKQSSK